MTTRNVIVERAVAVQTPRVVTRQAMVQRNLTENVVVSESILDMDEVIEWNQFSDQRLGHYEKTISVSGLPKAAGVRGTKIRDAANRILSDEDSDTEIRTLDRVMVRLPTGRTIGERELIRIVAVVGGLKDERATINVQVQLRDATGTYVADKGRLESRAREVWESIANELQGEGA